MGIIIVALIILLVVIIRKRAATDFSALFMRHDGIDSQHMGNLSTDEQTEIKKIADYCKVRYVTQKNIQEYTIYKISQDFSALPGWDIWDITVHQADGQYERLGRATAGSKITVLCYDPRYKLAKMQGSTGIYLTSSKRCSCPDYKKRRLPCKHMYALAIKLDGNVEKCIPCSEYGSLFGLKFALAGRFSNGRNSENGIRAKISEMGGTWSDTVSYDCVALIIGQSPSEAKINAAKSYDLEILPADYIDDLFLQT